MRVACGHVLPVVLAVLVVAAAASALGGEPRRQGGDESPLRVMLHIPFDGSADAAFSANGRTRTSYGQVMYRPGIRRRGQGAEIGSERFPCGLLVPCEGILDKERGTIEFWYMPLWNPADPTQQRARRTLVADDKPAGAVGQFWLGIEGAAVQFRVQGQQAWGDPSGGLVGVSASMRRWEPETWHHVVATWDGRAAAGSGGGGQGGHIRLFLDGVLAAELPLQWLLPQSETLYIGSDRYGGFRADGLFDEFRIYNRALTPTEVELSHIDSLKRENAPLAPRPVPAQPPAGAERKAPRLSFHATFDNILEAQTATGDPRPLVAAGATFQPGLSGQALVAGQGLRLAYSFAKNFSKDEGAMTLWARPLPEAMTWRGVLVADNRQDVDPQRDVPGSLALWLQRDGSTRATLALWPLRLHEALPRWDAGDWHHFAACWRRGERVVFYVNGQEVGRATGAQATWGGEPPERLLVGSLDGRIAAGALLDDLRFYDVPLSRAQVQKEAAQFILPLVLELGRTLFVRGEAAELVARFYNGTSEEVHAQLSVRVLAPDGREVARSAPPIEAHPHQWVAVRLRLSAEALGSEGLYQVVTSCEGRPTCPKAYFLVVSPEGQAPAAEDGSPSAGAEHLQTIECAKQSGVEAFCESGGSRVVRGEVGDYREAAAYPDARIAYRFRIERVGVPHVAEVTYPADRARAAEIIMTSRHQPASFDVATGYLVDQEEAASAPRMVTLPIYFWPREKEHALVFRTLLGGQPAACARLVIRRLPERLPPARVERPAEGGRSIGLHWDDPAVPVEFGALGQTPPEIYESFRRLVDYLCFTGQDLLCYPVAWHFGPLYPTAAEEFRLGTGGDRHCTDWVEYVLHLCEQRGIKFIPEIAFDDSVALSRAYSAHTATMVAEGTPTARMVLWDDTLSRGEPGGPPRYNPLHPVVRAAVLERITEVVERYGKSPALVGVSLVLGPQQATWFGSIQCGYDDETVAEFVKETGVEIPEGKAGPTRFSERARWLLTNRYDQWVAFRCRRLRQVYVDLASRLQSKRPNLALYLSVALPDAASWQPLMNLTPLAARPGSLGDLYKEAGLDIALYKDRPANLFLRRVTYPTDDRYLAYRFGPQGPNPHPVLVRDHALLSEGGAPLIGFPRQAAAFSHRYFESAIGMARPMPGFWWREHPLRASHPTPAGRRFLEPLAHAVAEHDALSLSVGGGTLATAGHEPELLEFARAFRALPAETFISIGGLSDPVCARELHRGDGLYFYLVNRTSHRVDAYVGFSAPDVSVRDFVAAKDVALPQVNKREVPAALPNGFVSEHALPEEEGPLPGEPGATQPLSGSLLHVTLEPYQLRSYRVLTAGALISYVSAQAPAAYRARLAQRIESAKGLVANSKAGVEAIAAARATLDLIARAWRKHELSRVELLLESYPLARLR